MDLKIYIYNIYEPISTIIIFGVTIIYKILITPSYICNEYIFCRSCMYIRNCSHTQKEGRVKAQGSEKNPKRSGTFFLNIYIYFYFSQSFSKNDLFIFKI